MDRKLSEELDYKIRYDVEHDLFHAQNVFNDEYIKPTFIEYVQKLEKENAELKNKNKWYSEQVCNKECAEVWGNLDKAKELLIKVVGSFYYLCEINNFSTNYECLAEVEQFLKEINENE